MSHDYVIVGAGAAGCVLAERLSVDPSVSVLLVEDGGRGRSPLLTAPRAFPYALRSDRHVHRYATRPTHGLPPEWWVRGRGLGGSTAVNGLMYLRGAAADFDAIEAAGNPGWGWREVLEAYQQIENHALGGSDTRGSGGPLGVSIPPSDDPVVLALIAAHVQRGIRQVEDVNVSDDERIGLAPATIDRGRRVSAATAFLYPALRRPNLRVVTGARVDRLVLRGERATGVLLRRKGHQEVVLAAREVILSAGTLESPAILERSGIGRRDVLAAAGVQSVVDARRVGEGMIEHRGVSLQVRFRSRMGPTERLNTPVRRAVEAARWILTRSGPIATSGYDLVGQHRSTPDQTRPDLQGVWVPLAIDERFSDLRPAPYSGLLFTGYALRPTSAGSVHIGSSDPDAPLTIEPHYLEDRAERTATGTLLDHARGVIFGSGLAEQVEKEVFPTARISSAEAVVHHARLHGGGVYHAVGSCAMGPDEDHVVGTDLRVRGVDHLRVVDASVLPHQVSGNPSAPTMAIAWLAATRIRHA